MPGPGRVVLARPEADLDGYALLADGTVARRLERRTASPSCGCTTVSDGAVLRRIDLPEPVMPGWSLAADGATLLAELTGPRAPRALWRVPLDRRRAGRRPLPGTPDRPDPSLLV